jgi:hypothetical protein
MVVYTCNAATQEFKANVGKFSDTQSQKQNKKKRAGD